MSASLTTLAPRKTAAHGIRRAAAIVLGAVALACSGGAAQAAPHGGYHGGGWHGGGYYRGGGWGWGPFLGLGLGLGLAGAYYYDQPDYVVVNPAPYYPPPPAPGYGPAPTYAPQPAQAPAPMANPIFYPRNGQNATQVEADRQACNRWATTQVGAQTDASIFQRATLACMDGRGYTSR